MHYIIAKKRNNLFELTCYNKIKKMTHDSQSFRVKKPQVEPLWTICSLDKNAIRLALLYEMLSSLQKKGISVFDQMMYRSQASRSPLAAPFMECFCYISKHTSFLEK